jgi:hypothetical protein
MNYAMRPVNKKSKGRRVVSSPTSTPQYFLKQKDLIDELQPLMNEEVVCCVYIANESWNNLSLSNSLPVRHLRQSDPRHGGTCRHVL